jgi:hypothetical protein
MDTRLELSNYLFFKKFPKFGADQHCANCALYQGKATDNTARLHAVARRAGGGSRVVQRLGEEGVNTLAGHEASR